MRFAFLVLGIFLPVTALAQDPCHGISGCTAQANQLIPFIALIVTTLVEIAAGLSVLFVVIGGAFLILNFGNEANATKGRTQIFFALGGFALVLASQAIISFVVARSEVIDPTLPHLSIMQVVVQSMLQVFNVVFALIMIYFGFRLVLGHGQQSELDSFKKGIFWSISGALAVNLAYALVNAVVQLGF